jgi:hypothetical protein
MNSTENRPLHFRVPPYRYSARPHQRRHHSLVCIYCHQSCHRHNLISIFIVLTANLHSQVWRTSVVIVLGTDLDDVNRISGLRSHLCLNTSLGPLDCRWQNCKTTYSNLTDEQLISTYAYRPVTKRGGSIPWSSIATLVRIHDAERYQN